MVKRSKIEATVIAQNMVLANVLKAMCKSILFVVSVKWRKRHKVNDCLVLLKVFSLLQHNIDDWDLNPKLSNQKSVMCCALGSTILYLTYITYIASNDTKHKRL